MRKELRRITLVLLILGIAVFVFSGSVKAEESDTLAQELMDEGVSQDTMNELLSEPGDTLGERAQSMLNNGLITQRQYDKIYNNMMNMPEEKRQALKNAYDKGYGGKVYDRVADEAHQQMEDPSIRDHVKDLKQQGLSREEIKDRIENAKDKKEDLRDRREDIKDRREDIKDKREDIRDRKEDIWDAKHDGGKKDKLEDIRDRKEDIRDRKEDVRDRKEDMKDRKEDRRDRREDLKDKPRVREGAHNQRGGGGRKGK